jgi:hypothetical protein
MANAYKILGQSALSATTNTDVYTVPSATETIVSTLIIANRGAANTTYRVALRPDGATIADQHYIAYDVAIDANDSTTMTLGLTMDATDKLTVYTAGSSVSVSVFGLEIS